MEQISIIYGLLGIIYVMSLMVMVSDTKRFNKRHDVSKMDPIITVLIMFPVVNTALAFSAIMNDIIKYSDKK